MKVTPEHYIDTADRDEISGGASMNTRRLIVVHYTAGASGESSISWWRKLANGVCAHLVIERDGSITQVRPFNRTCGHAGKSRWVDPNTDKAYHGVNHCSIGIELANGGSSYPDKFSPLPPTLAKHKDQRGERKWETYPQAQLDACKEVCKVLVERYNLDDVVGHEDVSPGRKSDPGPAFPMEELRESCGFKGLPV